MSQIWRNGSLGVSDFSSFYQRRHKHGRDQPVIVFLSAAVVRQTSCARSGQLGVGLSVSVLHLHKQMEVHMWTENLEVVFPFASLCIVKLYLSIFTHFILSLVLWLAECCILSL